MGHALHPADAYKWCLCNRHSAGPTTLWIVTLPANLNRLLICAHCNSNFKFTKYFLSRIEVGLTQVVSSDLKIMDCQSNETKYTHHSLLVASNSTR